MVYAGNPHCVLTHNEGNVNPTLPPLRPLFSYRRVRECLPEFLNKGLVHTNKRCFSDREGAEIVLPHFRRDSAELCLLVSLQYLEGAAEGF